MTTTASECRKDVLKKWKQIAADRKMILVVTGRSGSGKTTLINTMLEKECQNDGGSTTTAIHSYSNDIEGVEVEMIDTPGLGMPGQNDKHIFDDLQMIAADKKVDMLLYCISVLPNSKMDAVELKIIEQLTQTFGKYMWEKTIIVFTFANVMLKINEDNKDILKAVMQSYAKEFQSKLHRIGVNATIFVICEDADHHRDITQSHVEHKIPALPTGLSQEFPEGARWDITIYEEIYKNSKKLEENRTANLFEQKRECTVQ